MEVLQGKWWIPTIISLTDGDKRFGAMQREIGISPKMLSQELKALEENKIISRTFNDDSMPVTVEYSLTPLGKSTDKLLNKFLKWGIHFRNEIAGK
ncbi:MAG: helix-turn-helix transcriptional regulator [Chitinophagaceae bacterium]|nr:helix-turn-helix transcriptional regulator [Chitinophagaceae bacterium]